jgi:hypothetical protein
MLRRLSFPLLLLAMMLAIGCSSGSGNLTVPVEPEKSTAMSGSHQLWGLWQFTADIEAQTLDAVQLRMADMHVNVLPFLEPPPLVNMTLESLQFNGDIIEVDIGLRHPFLGLAQFTGFDVCGIFISNGSVSGFSDSDLLMTGEGDTRLLNPDGLTRWWNPAEFPVNLGTMFSYNDGLLGAPDSYANYNCTLNGYKYFCDDLNDPDSPLSDITLANRGLFSPGQKNVRHYTIEMGGPGLVFNYAIDANWQFPAGDPPYNAPDDFAAEASRPEAYRIEVTELENTLWNDGVSFDGDLTLSVDVYDWYDSGLNTVRIEAPGEIPVSESAVPAGSGAGYSTYEVYAGDCTPSSAGELMLLITVESDVVDYGGLLPGETVSAYFTYTTIVDDEEPGPTNCPNVENEAYTYTATPTTMSGVYAYTDPFIGEAVLPATQEENCIDMDFLNNDQNRLVLNGRNDQNVIGAITPITGAVGGSPVTYISNVETMSIDCDLTDRIIYVLFDDSALPAAYGVNSYERLFPLRTDLVAGADTKFFVYDISEAGHIGTSYDVGARIWAIETDANDDIWVLDENHYMHHYENNGTSYTLDSSTSFDIDTTVPAFSGIVFDFAIDYYNEAFYILTNGAADGLLYRVECDGTFSSNIDGNPNPLTDVWNYDGNDRADIVIDNLDSSGNIHDGEQDAQILCVTNYPGTHWGQSVGASKIGITRVNAALGSVVRYEYTGGTYVGYGAVSTAMNDRTNSIWAKNGPPYGNQHIIREFFVPSGQWY